jgi:uncharacterized protein YxjI
MRKIRYQMRQDFFSFGDDFTVKDDAGRDVFFIDGKALSIGDKLIFQDMAGNELARIRERLLSIGKTYDISLADGTTATIHKHLFTLFRAAFTVDVPGPGDLEASGSFLDHDYSFQRGGRSIATVSKKWFSLRDTYGIDILSGENDVLILASAVVIDLCCHPDQKQD